MFQLRERVYGTGVRHTRRNSFGQKHGLFDNRPRNQLRGVATCRSGASARAAPDRWRPLKVPDPRTVYPLSPSKRLVLLARPRPGAAGPRTRRPGISGVSGRQVSLSAATRSCSSSSGSTVSGGRRPKPHSAAMPKSGTARCAATRPGAVRVGFQMRVGSEQRQLPGDPVAALAGFAVGDALHPAAQGSADGGEHRFGVRQGDAADEVNRGGIRGGHVSWVILRAMPARAPPGR